jgi:2-dehydro-3-deoxyphosphogluconate aldolase/(4S)-4-hydroxy-2-oxoglutarate aldolase
MPAFPNEMLERVCGARLVAGFSVDRLDDAVPIANALLEGGIECIELTLRTPVAVKAIQEIASNVPQICLGIGTILSPEQVRMVADAGADFGVAPGTNPSVIREARSAGFPFAPGICTPTDLEAAIGHDCRFVKFFPAEASGGLPYLQSMAAPYRHLGISYFPLGGINARNMVDYLKTDIVGAVGGSWIVQREHVRNKDWSGIATAARKVTSVLKEME